MITDWVEFFKSIPEIPEQDYKLGFDFKPYITYREFNQAIKASAKDTEGYTAEHYVIAALVSEIDNVEIPDTEDKYEVVLRNVGYDHIECTRDGYFQKRDSYNSYPEVDSLENIDKVELVLPLSNKKVKPKSLTFDLNTWQNIVDIKRQFRYETLIPGDVIIAQWLEGGVEELLELPEEDVYYLINFLISVVGKSKYTWKLSKAQLAEWDKLCI